MKLWKIYYDDGTTFDSDQGQPHEAPAMGFILALGYDQAGTRHIMQGWDHYCFDRATQQWWGMDLFGVFDRLRFNKEIYAYKEGRTISKIAWQDMLIRANNDPDFPKRRAE